MDLLEVIKDYQETADKVVNLFKAEFEVDDILEGWYTHIYSQIGSLMQHGIKQYFFHGIGLAVDFEDKSIDFDFAFFPEPRHDGFDIWRLNLFVQAQPKKYSEFLKKGKLENDFTKLINRGIITNPQLENATTLYFFTNEVKTSFWRALLNKLK